MTQAAERQAVEEELEACCGWSKQLKVFENIWNMSNHWIWGFATIWNMSNHWIFAWICDVSGSGSGFTSTTEWQMFVVIPQATRQPVTEWQRDDVATCCNTAKNMCIWDSSAWLKILPITSTHTIDRGSSSWIDDYQLVIVSTWY